MSTSLLNAQIIATTLPTDPTVSSGSATFSQTENKLTVNQSTDKLITNWKTFNIGSDATVQFIQPSNSSVALNRIGSLSPSYIYGNLTANGKLFLINSSGIFFGPNSSVNVGALVASTLNISDSSFLSGQYTFENNNSAGSIENYGNINGGVVAFIAPQIKNNGTITASNGTAALLSGDKLTVTFADNNLISYSINQGTLNSLIENNNAIIADNGVVILSAVGVDAVQQSVVNNTGLIQAQGIIEKGGKIYLNGDQTTSSGVLDVSSKDNRGGLVQITGDTVTLTSTSVTNASGTTGGGTINIGGSFQNSDPSVRQAILNNVQNGAVLNASATDNGDGGTITVWSDINNLNSQTFANGTFITSAGVNGGNGGNIETSGYYLNVDNISVDASSPLGNSGTWLLDPYNITINGSGSALGTSYSNRFTAATTSTILASSISTALSGGTSVTISTGSTASDSSTITLNADIGKTASNSTATLTLTAGGDITLNGGIYSTRGTLNLNTNSYGGNLLGTGGSGANAGISLNGGTFSVTNVGDGGLGYAGAIKGTGSLTKLGTGTLTLSGANTYTGATNIKAGTLILDGTEASAGAVLSNTGAVNVNGGTLQLNDITETVGVVTLTNGAITVGSVGNSLNGTSYNLNPGDGVSVSVSAVLAGSGSLTKSELGTVTLSGANTYTGDTNVNDGKLILGNNEVISNSSALVIRGGTLDMAGFSETVASLASAGGGKGNITTNGSSDATSVLTFGGNNSNTTFAGDLADGTSKLAITKEGRGTFIIAGGTSYSGDTTINAGKIDYRGKNTGSSNIVVADGGNLTLDNSVNVPSITIKTGGALSVRGDITTQTLSMLTGANISATGSLLVTGKSIIAGAITTGGTQTYNDLINLADNTVLTGSIINTSSAIDGSYRGNTYDLTIAANAEINGKITNINNLLVNGTTRLANDVSTYNDQIYTGAVTLANNSSLVSNLGNIEFKSTITGNDVYGLTTNAAGNTDFKGAISNLGNLNVTTNTLTANAITITNGGEVFVKNSSDGLIAGVISGENVGLTKDGAGILTLNGKNTYTGNTTVLNGTLLLGGDEVISDLSSLVLKGGTFDLGGFSETVGSLDSIGSQNKITSNSKDRDDAISILTVGQNNKNSKFYGEIEDGKSLVALTKVGSGELELHGKNTYSGDTTYAGAGKIKIKGNTSRSDTSRIVVKTENVDISDYCLATCTIKSIKIFDGGSLTIGNSYTVTATSVSINGGGKLTVDAGSTLITDQLTLYPARNSYNANDRKDPDTNVTLASLVLNGELVVGYTKNDNNSNSANIVGGGNSDIYGVISGDGKITKVGESKLRLFESNTFKGGIDINDGIVEVGNNNAFGLGTVKYYGGVISTVSAASYDLPNVNFTGTGNNEVVLSDFIIGNRTEFWNYKIKFNGNAGKLNFNKVFFSKPGRYTIETEPGTITFSGDIGAIELPTSNDRYYFEWSPVENLQGLGLGHFCESNKQCDGGNFFNISQSGPAYYNDILDDIIGGSTSQPEQVQTITFGQVKKVEANINNAVLKRDGNLTDLTVVDVRVKEDIKISSDIKTKDKDEIKKNN